MRYDMDNKPRIAEKSIKSEGVSAKQEGLEDVQQADEEDSRPLFPSSSGQEFNQYLGTHL
jgi:hypothetical protein